MRIQPLWMSSFMKRQLLFNCFVGMIMNVLFVSCLLFLLSSSHLINNNDDGGGGGGFAFASATSLSSSSKNTMMMMMRFRAIDVLNNHRRNHNKNYNRDINNEDPYSDVQELYITQHLDHYNAANIQYTFQQRYFYSDRYVSKSSNEQQEQHQLKGTSTQQQQQRRRQIAFLCVGGEGPYLDKSVLYNSPHCTGDMLYSAKRIMDTAESFIDIHLFALEHRYYGESYPQSFPPSSVMDNNNPNNNGSLSSSSSPVTNERLIYLSSRQSLSDLAHFISLPQYSNYEWIVFGASYPGVLAAWSRYHYPHLISGAISNSAPIQSLLDMAVYHNHVGSVLQNPIIGGSTLCLQIFQLGHQQLIDAIQYNNTDIAIKLNLCNLTALTNHKNIQLLIGDGILYPGTQENDPSCDNTNDDMCNIGGKCSALINYYNNNISTTSSLTKEMDTLIWAVTRNQDSCMDVDWEGTIQYISDPIVGMNEGLRSWLWQTCTEFGFYQTCEIHSTCPFAQGYHPLSQDLEICTRSFNINNTAEFIQDTNVWSGGWSMKHSGASKIVSITGTIDPWSELALEYNPVNNNHSTNNDYDPIHNPMPVYQVKGASHHFWTHAIKATDGPDIDAARDYIYHTVRQFLDLDPIPPSHEVIAKST